MSNCPYAAPPFEDGLAISVAVVGRDERGELVITACNGPFLQMVGATHADVPTFPVTFDSLVPDGWRRALRETLKACLAPDAAPHEQACEIPDVEDDAQHWCLSLQPVTQTRGGAAVREILATGVKAVKTEKAAKAAPASPLADELQASAARYRAVVDSAYDAIVAIDQQHNITLFNRAAENLFGYTSAEVLGQPIEMLLPERFRAGHSQRVRQFANTVQMSERQVTPPRMDGSNSVYGRHRNGSVIPVEIAISKIDVNGVTEFTAVVRDITDRAQLMEQLKKQAGTDALTGLPNRREFLDFVDKALGADDVLSAFILDIDFFKKINDSYGHDAGDEVLRVLGKVGLSVMQDSNVFARWGGEEFVAALPGADANVARKVAEQLRQRIEQHDFEHAWRLEAIPFTVSIGVVTREAGERDVDALMKRADRALYRAKQLGRNRVEVG
ncbi:sensor domain-containing diguanylate cyclase [Paraburkholderia kururiensis]|uniref:sensor domain-containing diguanylate cyclase n=1 Tax=Paraburkholderia kururiensis TaxID=984307 RepID=UPI0005A780C6|nr:diguanylate cyclase [Paraburkholderia kururiensis]